MQELAKAFQAQFNVMCNTGMLFISNITGREVRDAYLNGFEDDPVFRDPESSVHNCNNCNNFMCRYGNIVALKDGKLISIWDAPNIDSEYKASVEAVAKLLTASKIKDVFVETFSELKSLPYEVCKKNQETFLLGVDVNRKKYSLDAAEAYKNADGSYIVSPDEERRFDHMHLRIPSAFIDKSSKSIGAIQGEFRVKAEVFGRTMSGISLETFQLMKELITQGSLLDSNKYLNLLDSYIQYKKDYKELTYHEDNFFWETTYALSEPVATFGSSLQGTFLKEVSEGKDINKACIDYNKRIDPSNYMKAKAPITEAQKRLAEKFVVENGWLASFDRRLATLDDIRASEILHINRNKPTKEVTIFDSVKTNASGRHKRSEFDKVELVGVKKFMEEILPTASSVEVLLENSHRGNLVNLTTTEDPDAKPLFKWGNPFGYTFNGGLAGKSNIVEAVKSAGGKVDGVLRFSIMWAENDRDNSDLDAHCVEPNGNRIYHARRKSSTGGNLDVDITNPKDQSPNGAVENITYPKLNAMADGDYVFLVNQFHSRNSKGFKAEIAFGNEVFSYEYTMPVRGEINVATVSLRNGELTIKHHLKESSASEDLWGLATGEFHKVNLVSTTPNHWGDKKVGNNHYLFMLQGCKNPEPVRGFHNEHLVQHLLDHRKVLDVLGQTAMIPASDNQVSGLGFNETVRDELIVRVSGTFKRVLKIQF